MMLHAQVHLTLPVWVHDQVDLNRNFDDDASKVALVIELARLNVANASGGPFGAAIFDAVGRVLSIGVNRVIPETCSVAHAEMMAFMIAQQRSQQFRLNAIGGPITLASSAQPCCMCYGATFWAGIDRLLIGARASDVMALTEFDEGPLPADWIGELERRDIQVYRDIQREAACTVLRHYGEQAGGEY